jgi:hypothetical protein
MAHVARAAARELARAARPPATVSPTEGYLRCVLLISILKT